MESFPKFGSINTLLNNKSARKPEKKRIWTALVLLMSGLLLTLTASLVMKSFIEKNAEKEFISTCTEINNKILTTLLTDARLLRSYTSFYENSDIVTRNSWRNFSTGQMIENNSSGIYGVGYAAIILPGQLTLHEKKIQSEGFPQYSVRPKGKREIYTSIIYTEPFSGENSQSFGYDMFSEPVRRTAMEKSRDNNLVSLSGKIMTGKGTNEDMQAGMLMYAPVYRKGMPTNTVEERRHAIIGWAYSSYKINNLMANIPGAYETVKEKHINLKISDDSLYSHNAMLYDNRKMINTSAISPSVFSLQTSLTFNNHQWYLLFTQHDPGMSGLDYSKMWFTAAGGTIISILLFIIYLMLITANIRDRQMCEKLTRNLDESEHKYKTLANSGQILVWASGTDKLCYYFNQVWLEFTGRTPEQEMGNGWTDGIHPDDFQRCLDIYTSAFDRREKFSMDYHLKHHDGQYRRIKNNGTPGYNSSGEFIGYFGHCYDITGLILSAEALKLRESYMSSIIENQPGLLWLKDIDGKFLAVNSKFLNSFGFNNPNLLIGKTDLELYPRELADKYIKDDLKVIESKKPVVTEDSISDNGVVKWFESVKTPVIDDKGRVIGTTGYSIEITGRKQAEETLRKSVSRFELAMNVADMAWWEMELPEGNIFFGKRKAEVLGFPPEKFKHYKDFTDLVHPDDYNHIMNAMRGHLYGAFDKYETEYRIQTSSNNYRWFYDIGAIIDTHPGGKPRRIAGLVIDITERKIAQMELLKLNEELQISKAATEEALAERTALVEELTRSKEYLEKINAEKNKLFSIISHDLKGPFQGLMKLTESMTEDINESSQAELSITSRTIFNTSKKLFALLSNLLEWARMQQGSIRFNPGETDLSLIVNQNIDLILQRSNEKGVDLIQDIPDNQIVYADETMLNSTLRNLLSNAVKFTKRGGKVLVKARKTDNNMMEISVTDNGIGIPEALLKKLFNMAEEVGRKGTDGESSTGLGLLLCKDFVEKHGGRIWAESTGKNGSVFYFTLHKANKDFQSATE
ncbi:MAG: CHASE domain-containing protein [Ignavibacteria bacterium]